jgi:hypothetical protein
MASDTPAVNSRPRPWLLILLALAIVAFVASRMWPAPSPPSGAATTAPVARKAPGKATAAVDPADLDVRLDALNGSRPPAEAVDRNPFRFQPRPAPPPPPGPSGPPAARMPGPPPVEGPPPVPPIPLKFIGIVEKQGLKVAALSDCRSTFYGSEGQIIDGRYRLVHIGIESLVIEYLDGTGRTTVRLEGCPPR